MEYTIRRVGPGDEEALAAIQTSSWKAAFSHILAPEDLERYTRVDKAAKMYARMLAENKGNGYIGELDGVPHCIAYWDSARDARFCGYAELICIHSLPGNWRRGYGSRMMETVLSDIARAGYEQVLLWVFTENYRARAFYEANGFRATHATQAAFGATEICYVRDVIQEKLYQQAIALIETRYPTGWGGAAAIRTSKGSCFTSVAIETANASAGLCIETGAICEAHKYHEKVTHCLCVVRESPEEPYQVLSPCGICQERLRYWGEDVLVGVTSSHQKLKFLPLRDLSSYHWSRAYPAEELDHFEEIELG